MFGKDETKTTEIPESGFEDDPGSGVQKTTQHCHLRSPFTSSAHHSPSELTHQLVPHSLSHTLSPTQRRTITRYKTNHLPLMASGSERTGNVFIQQNTAGNLLSV